MKLCPLILNQKLQNRYVMKPLTFILFFVVLLLSITSCALKKPKQKVVIAHRGASGYLPEHTLEAAAMAHSFGVDYIEPDVVLTKDNKAIVLHDIHIDTTTNVKKIFPNKKRSDGRYYAIDLTLAEIKKLDVNERVNIKNGNAVFSQRFPVGRGKFEVPTLHEFIELVQGLNKSTGRDIGIYPELKSPEFHSREGKDIAKVVMKILRKYGYEKDNSKAIIQCFYPPTLKRLKQEFKTKIPLVLLLAENSWGESSVDYDKIKTKEGVKEISQFVDGIGPYFFQIANYQNNKYTKSQLVAWAHENNLFVHPYTHRSDALPQKMNDKIFFDFIYNEVGVDGVFSDFSDVALRFSR